MWAAKRAPIAPASSASESHERMALAARAKQRGPKRNAGSRSARLEEKLDQLVTLLRAQQPGQVEDDGTNSGDEGVEMDDGVNSLSASLLSTPSTGENISDDASVMNDDSCFQQFREELMWFTPYVYLPPETTSDLVRQTYPFFWLNVMAVTSGSAKRRNCLSLQSRRTIIERVVAGGERSLDLLLGLLTFINWVHLFPMDKQFASLASQLAVSLVWDLGLQMPPPEHPPRFPPPLASTVAQHSVNKERTLEEQRVVLGSFVITSMVSQTFKVAEGLRWSAHLDEYLVQVSNSTIPQDSVLVRQVKMQLIINQVRYSSWKMNTMEMPTAWVDVLQSQLDELVATDNGNTFTFGSESTMLRFYHYTTLIIREWIMVKSSIPKYEPDLRRYQVYQRCINSIKAWLDLFFAMPLRLYTTVPCSMYSQLCYVVVFLHQITTTREAAWNPVAAQEIVDLFQTLDRIIHTFEQLKASGVEHNPGDVD
ncbi:C6 transcription factor [Seiridium cupressi]